MLLDYASVRSVRPEHFKALSSRHDIKQYTKSDAKDLMKIEKLLDLRFGTLKNEEYFVSKHDCACGRRLTFFDFVYTAVKDTNHSKSFILHTLLGSKLVVNQARVVRCSDCDSAEIAMNYITPNYCCCRDDGFTPVDDETSSDAPEDSPDEA